VAANNSTVTSLSVANITPVSIASGSSLSGGITVSAGSLKLNETGELASTIAMSGGVLDADESLAVSGALTQSGDITVDVADNKTLTYSGTAISLGAKTLTLSGGGTLSNTNALVLNDANSLLSLSGILVIGDVDGTTASNSGKGIQVTSSATLGDYDLSAVSYLSIAANQTLAGQLNLQTNGELKTSGDGQYIGDIALAGGKFSATDNQVLGGTLSITGNSELTVSQNYTLTLSQSGGLALGGNMLTLSGGGSLVSGGLTLDNASSKLVLNSITVDNVSTTSDSLGLDVDANSTVTSLTVAHTTPVSIASGRTLSGAITVSAGSIKLDEAGTLASTIAMSGGTLDADESLTLSGALTQSGNITIDVAENKTLTYSGAAVNLGANTLTLSGEGRLSNSNALVLNNASSKLLLSNSITVDSVRTSLASLGLDVDANSTVTSLTVGHTTPVSIVSGRTLSGAITVTAGSIKLDEAGTLASSVSMSGGTLDADESLTLSGALSQSGNITIDVSDNKTLTYSGTAISLGANTLTLSGGGSLISGGLTLNNADRKLLRNSITLDNVSTSANSLGLDVDNNSIVTSLSVGHITPVSIASGKSLSGAITVTAGSLKLNETGTLASTILMSGGVLDADESSTVSGALTHTGNITIDVADPKTLTYSGTAISLGANTLTLTGGGSLVSGGLTLNDPSSTLLLNSITVDSVSTSADSSSGGLDVDDNSTVSSLSVAHITPVSIASGKTLSGAITVTAGSLKLTETCTLASSISMSGGALEADNSLTVSGTLTQSGDIDIEVLTDKTLTYTGTAISLGANTLTLSGGGSLVSGGLTLNDASSKLLLNSITVDNVSTTSDSSSGGLDVDDNSTITALSVANITPVAIASGKSLSGAITVTAGSLKLSEAGTLASSVSMSGGTLDADNSLTVSGALTQSGNITIDVADNKTLTYSGTAISLGANTLTQSGGGTFSNTNALVLNDADSLLSLAGILTIGDVEGTAASNTGKGIQVLSSATLGDYDLSAVSYLAIAATKTLAGQLNLQSGGELKISGDGQYTGDIALAGGKFSATDSQVLSGTLSITADSELAVSENYTLTLSQTGGLSLGANTLTISGGGNLVSGGLTLNDAAASSCLTQSRWTA